MIVPRVIPQDAKKQKITFNNNLSNDVGKLYFSKDGDLNEEKLKNIKNLDDVVLLDNELKLYFPAYENYMVTVFDSQDGKYRLRDILNLANKVGYIFYYIYSDEKEGSIIGEYALCNYYIKDNNIYLEPDRIK